MKNDSILCNYSIIDDYKFTAHYSKKQHFMIFKIKPTNLQQIKNAKVLFPLNLIFLKALKLSTIYNKDLISCLKLQNSLAINFLCLHFLKNGLLNFKVNFCSKKVITLSCDQVNSYGNII